MLFLSLLDILFLFNYGNVYALAKQIQIFTIENKKWLISLRMKNVYLLYLFLFEMFEYTQGDTIIKNDLLSSYGPHHRLGDNLEQIWIKKEIVHKDYVIYPQNLNGKQIQGKFYINQGEKYERYTLIPWNYNENFI